MHKITITLPNPADSHKLMGLSHETSATFCRFMLAYLYIYILFFCAISWWSFDSFSWPIQKNGPYTSVDSISGALPRFFPSELLVAWLCLWGFLSSSSGFGFGWVLPWVRCVGSVPCFCFACVSLLVVFCLPWRLCLLGWLLPLSLLPLPLPLPLWRRLPRLLLFINLYKYRLH